MAVDKGGREVAAVRGEAAIVIARLKSRLPAPIPRDMDGLFVYLSAGLLALFAVAVLVAGWEHLRRSERRVQAAPPTPKAVRVDVDIDALVAAPGDQAQRQIALEGAMTRAASDLPPPPWVDTRPMVGPGALAPSVAAGAEKG